MKMVWVTNATRGAVLAENALAGESFWVRLRGLLGKRALLPGQGLLMAPCRAVHTFGMRFPIDVVYITQERRVIRVATTMPPNRCGPWVKGSYYVLELPAGTVARTGTVVGDRIEMALAEDVEASVGAVPGVSR